MTEAAPHIQPSDIGAILDLERLADTRFRNRVNDANMRGALFGGQVLAQALRAAQLTTPAERPVHSLHAYFIRAGRTGQPVDLSVEVTRDGGSFSTRRVTAAQGGADILHLEASFHAEGDEGFDHETGPRASAPPPETLADTNEIARRYADRLTPAMQRRLTNYRTLEIRPVNPEMLVEPQAEARASHWLRVPSAAGLAPDLQACALAYASDSWLAPVTRVVHASVLDLDRFQVASLDHAMWFLRPVRLDGWMLYETESPWTGAGRGLARGALYDRDGRICAVVAQEALLRPMRARAG